MEIFVTPSDTLYIIGAVTVIGLLVLIGAIDGGDTSTLRGRIAMTLIGALVAHVTWLAIMFFTTATPTSWWNAVESIAINGNSSAKIRVFAWLNVLFVASPAITPFMVVFAIARTVLAGMKEGEGELIRDGHTH